MSQPQTEAGPGLRIRSMGPADRDAVRRCLVLALAWNRDPGDLLGEEVLAADELDRYHAGFGRQSDFGLVAEQDGHFAGAAFGRLFEADAPGYGYVDADVAEIAVGVEPRYRNQGIGTVLLDALDDAARRAGHHRLSLSVAVDNPALQLYRRLGWRLHSTRAGAVTMVRNLDA